MKDYLILRGMSCEEWKQDKEWLAHRMQFIWDYRNLFTEDYLKNGMAKELQSRFYGVNDIEVSRIAAKLDCYTKEEIEHFESMSKEQMKSNYLKLKNMPRSEVVKRPNRMMYIYILENADKEIFDDDCR